MVGRTPTSETGNMCFFLRQTSWYMSQVPAPSGKLLNLYKPIIFIYNSVDNFNNYLTWRVCENLMREGIWENPCNGRVRGTLIRNKKPQVWVQTVQISNSISLGHFFLFFFFDFFLQQMLFDSLVCTVLGIETIASNDAVRGSAFISFIEGVECSS